MLINEDKQRIITKAKRATQRLRSLEKKNYTKASNAYKHLSDEYEMKSNTDFVTLDKYDRLKFTTSMTELEKNNVSLSEYEEYLDRFLSAKTSTTSGVNEKYMKQYLKFTDNNLDIIDFDDFKNALDNVYNSYLTSFFDSGTTKELTKKNIKASSIDEIVNLINNLENKTKTKREEQLLNLFRADLEKAVTETKDEKALMKKVKKTYKNISKKYRYDK